jgi:hypothetical protein
MSKDSRPPAVDPARDLAFLPSRHHEDPVPTYTESDPFLTITTAPLDDNSARPQQPSTSNNPTDDSSRPPRPSTNDLSSINSLPALDVAGLSLPLTTYPPSPYRIAGIHNSKNANTTSDNTLSIQEATLIYRRASVLINSFFQSIRTQNTEALTLLVNRGLISPDCPDSAGATPLIAAVEAGHGAVVCAVVALGADVNLPGTFKWKRGRTPLMVAAASGNLALAKLLLEDFHADDSIVAPDGQIALRLAADGKHREVVAYLPRRNGGEWLRWKTHHDQSIKQVLRALNKIRKFVLFFIWEVPRFFLWTVPKHVVVIPVRDGVVWAWKNRKRFGGWVKRQAIETPRRIARAGKAVWRGIKKIPVGVKRAAQWVWKVVKKTPKAMRAVAEWLWKFVTVGIPRAVKVVALWIWKGLKAVGKAVAYVFVRLLSALHTAVMAVLDFFRNITLKDVWNGFKAVLEAVFVELPKAVWAGLKRFREVSYKVMEYLFGVTGEIIWWIVRGLLWVVQYVPEQLLKIVLWSTSSLAQGFHEILVWFNPKL